MLKLPHNCTHLSSVQSLSCVWLLATWWEELTHWKRSWCWERLKAAWEGDDRGWDGWMTSLMQWTWLWVGSGSWWWTERPGVLQSMWSQRVRHDWVTELNWTIDNAEIQRIIRDYYEKLYGNKMDSLEEMDRVFNKFNLPPLNQEDIEIMNNPSTSSETEAVWSWAFVS